jgi:leucyl-tRNA synthetase
MAAQYPYKEIEAKWQQRWNESGLYRTNPNPKDKYYLLVMFAYPSGDIHMGHFRNYTVGDALARQKMMQAKDVFYPFGWDAFGLPAENAAIKRNIHPEQWTISNIKVSRETLQKVGIAFDWEREIATCSPEFYKWNQWIFLRLLEAGLAYRKKAEVNWCRGCQTVLANEQVIQGECERCGSKVEKKALEQWFFRITAYAQRLLDDLDTLPGWPENVKAMQRNWIGRSEGLECDFPLEHNGYPLRIFTTRPDTIFGVTYMAIAPESPYVADLELDGDEKAAVDSYIALARQKTDMERTTEGEKDGVFTGRYAINPFSGEKIPIWVADYVLAGYGTGAVMAVPAHDDRDFAFAQKYNLPIRIVLRCSGKGDSTEPLDRAFTDPEGEMINSSVFNGKAGKAAVDATITYAEEKGFGERKVHFKLRDWLISRQRYWGTPIPVVHCPNCGIVPVPDDELPVRLPTGDIDFVPKGRSPLADAPSFMNVKCPRCGGDAQRDPDTMDTFVDSSWYFLRYLDPHNDREAYSRSEADKWLPIDKYIGGITHATGHLLYFRFFTKFLHDKGYLSVLEPNTELFNHGMVLDGQGRVMSKSLGNVTSPVDFMDKEGVDVARLTMFFAAPSDKEILWSDSGALGVGRFLDKLWRALGAAAGQPAPALSTRFERQSLSADELKFYIKLNQTIRRASEDYDGLQYNTVLAALMELMNEFGGGENLGPELRAYALAKAIQLLAPLAPHFAEEAWEMLGFQGSVFKSRWPAADSTALTSETITLAVQVNGKLRGQLEVPVDISETEAVARATSDPSISRFINGKKPVKTIFVPKRLLNLVVQ